MQRPVESSIYNPAIVSAGLKRVNDPCRANLASVISLQTISCKK